MTSSIPEQKTDKGSLSRQNTGHCWQDTHKRIGAGIMQQPFPTDPPVCPVFPSFVIGGLPLLVCIRGMPMH